MNGTIRNWLAHAGLGLLLALIFATLFGTASGGAVFGAVYFIAKEAGEFSAKHWDEPGRPLADFNPLHPLRTRDDRLDWFSGVGGALAGGIIITLI